MEQENSRPVYKSWPLILIALLTLTILLLVAASCIIGDYRGLIVFPLIIVVNLVFNFFYSIYVLIILFRRGYDPFEIKDMTKRSDFVPPKNGFLAALKMFIVASLYYLILSPVFYLNSITAIAYILMCVLAEIHGHVGEHLRQIMQSTQKQHDELQQKIRELEEEEEEEKENK